MEQQEEGGGEGEGEQGRGEGAEESEGEGGGEDGEEGRGQVFDAEAGERMVRLGGVGVGVFPGVDGDAVEAAEGGEEEGYGSDRGYPTPPTLCFAKSSKQEF